MNQRRSTLHGAGGDLLATTRRGNPPVTALDTIAWDTAVELAAKLAESGADTQAAELLAGMLSGLDPATAHPDHRVINARRIWLGCVCCRLRRRAGKWPGGPPAWSMRRCCGPRSGMRCLAVPARRRNTLGLTAREKGHIMAGQLPQHPRSRLRRRPPQGAPPAARRAAVDMAALIADLFNPDEIAAAMNQVELARSAPARPANDVGRAGHGDPQPLPARQRGASCGSAVAASTGDERYAPQRNAVGLGSLLVCDGCDRPLQPSWGADGARLYVFLCGCRRNGVDAALVERLVRDRVEAESALLVTGVAVEELPAVLRGLFAEVRIGRSAEDLQFVWRV